MTQALFELRNYDETAPPDTIGIAMVNHFDSEQVQSSFQKLC